MKAIAFNGSARRDGNTAILLNCVLKELQAEGIQTELVQLGGQIIRGCTACRSCFERKDKRCIIETDMVNEYIAKMIDAEVILFGSPVYFSDTTSELKALLDRAGYVGRANGEFYKRKIGAAVVAVRRAGAMHCFDTINHFFLISQMIIPGSNYWNIGIGREKGDVENDREGIQTMETLGKNIAWLLKKLQGPA
jgi:multimeric flavodoxin WrbA